MKTRFILISVLLLYWTSVASSDYVLVLKNGRRIIAQSYREEGSMIKFHGLGGEIGISKDQIQTIQKDGDKERHSLSLTHPESAPPTLPQQATAQDKKPSPVTREAKAPDSREALTEQNAKEEKEYQQRVKEITEQLKELRDRYAAETRGNRGPEPAFFTSEEAFRGHQDDLISRLRDAQNNPAAPDRTGPSVRTPQGIPPLYTERQKSLSELRNQTNDLEQKRQMLIEEMRQKNFDTGSLFLE